MKAVHRHKWEVDFNDCIECGSFAYYICSCGETKDYKKSTPAKKGK